MNKIPAALLLAVFAAATTATVIATASADEAWHGFGEHNGSHCKDMHKGMDMDEMMTEQLDLTPDQKVQVQAILDQARPALKDLRDRMGENRKQLQALTQSDTPDETAIRTLADEGGKLKTEMIVQRSRMQAEIGKVLTPAQREQWKSMRSHDGMGHGHDHGHWEGERT